MFLYTLTPYLFLFTLIGVCSFLSPSLMLVFGLSFTSAKNVCLTEDYCLSLK